MFVNAVSRVLLIGRYMVTTIDEFCELKAVVAYSMGSLGHILSNN